MTMVGISINDLPQITDKMEIPLEFSATSGLEDEEIIKEQELINKIWQAV